MIAINTDGITYARMHNAIQYCKPMRLATEVLSSSTVVLLSLVDRVGLLNELELEKALV